MSNADITLKDKYFKITVSGDKWNVYYAETNFESKELYFRKTTMQIILHELIHVYVYYTYTETADLTARQNEEMCAEVISWNWDKIAELAAKVFTGLQSLKNEKE
jgi:hypothetical protein